MLATWDAENKYSIIPLNLISKVDKGDGFKKVTDILNLRTGDQISAFCTEENEMFEGRIHKFGSKNSLMRIMDCLKNNAIAAHDAVLGNIDENFIKELEAKIKQLQKEKELLETENIKLRADSEKYREDHELLNNFMIVAENVKAKRKDLGTIKLDVFFELILGFFFQL